MSERRKEMICICCGKHATCKCPVMFIVSTAPRPGSYFVEPCNAPLCDACIHSHEDGVPNTVASIIGKPN